MSQNNVNSRVRVGIPDRFEAWTVLYPTPERKRGYVVWMCRCDCGKERGLDAQSIRQNRPTSCGCVVKKGGPRVSNLVGEVINGIHVLRRDDTPRPTQSDRRVRYICRCHCGTEWSAYGTNLLKTEPGEGTKSCGCLRREAARTRMTTHGLSSHRIFRIYQGMKARCCNPSSRGYSTYGGRGIRICDSWLESFETFVTDMGLPPTRRHSIDRIDVNGDYSPANCRWATSMEQNLNKRNTILLTHNGVTKPAVTWARELGIIEATFKWWIRQHGVEAAFARAAAWYAPDEGSDVSTDSAAAPPNPVPGRRG